MPFAPSIQSLVGAHSGGDALGIDWARSRVFELQGSTYLSRYGILSGLEEAFINIQSLDSGAAGVALGVAANGNVFCSGSSGLNDGSALYIDGALTSLLQRISYPDPDFGQGGMTAVNFGTSQYCVDRGVGSTIIPTLNRISEISTSAWIAEQDFAGVGGRSCAGAAGTGVAYVLSAADGGAGPIYLTKLQFDGGTFVSSTLIGNIAMSVFGYTSQYQVQGVCLDQTDNTLLAVVSGVGSTTTGILAKIDPTTAGIDWQTNIANTNGSAPPQTGNVFSYSDIKNQRIAFFTRSPTQLTVYDTSDGSQVDNYTNGLAGLAESGKGACYNDTLGAIVLGCGFTQTAGSPTLLNSTPTTWSGLWGVLYVAAPVAPPIPPATPDSWFAIMTPVKSNLPLATKLVISGGVAGGSGGTGGGGGGGGGDTGGGGSGGGGSSGGGGPGPGAPTAVAFSGGTIAFNAAAATVVGTLSTTGGTGPYTYTCSNPKFTISGAQVLRSVTGALTGGVSESIDFTSTDANSNSINTATNGNGPFTINVTTPGTFSVPMKLWNIGGSSAAAPNVSYAHPFKDGDIPAGGSVTGIDSNGNPVTVQMDGVSTWPSGCVKWAVISHACAETFAAGSNKAYTLSSTNTPPDNVPNSGTWGATHALWVAAIAANSDFKVEYSGFDCGANTYRALFNYIIANYPERNPGWGTSYPAGGWEITKKGKACVEAHAWEYIKNVSTSKFQGYIRCDMWVKAWSPTGPFEIDVRTIEPNTWSTITGSTSTSEQFGQKQGRFAALVQVKNGSTVIKYDGGVNDTTLTTVPNANFITATGRLNYLSGAFFPQTAVTFASTGSLPTGLSANTLYWPCYPNGADQPYLAVHRYFCSLVDQNGIQPAWQASHLYNVNDWVLNGNTQYMCTVTGISAASGGPTGGAADSDITDGSVHWTNVTVGFSDQGSGTITASPVSMAFPAAGWPTADSRGDPIWSGSGSRPQMAPGHDFTYLTQQSTFTMAYNAAAGSVFSGQTQPPYLPTRQTGGMYWDQSQTGPSLLRIAPINRWGVAGIYRPEDPFYFYGILQGALCWHLSAYAFIADESGGAPLMVTGGTYAGLPVSITNWCDFNVPGSVSGTIVPRGADWSGWLSDNKNNSGTNGQYYADPTHVPMNSQMAYLKTGRPIFLESAIYQANSYCTMVYQGTQTLNGITRRCLINGAYGSTQLRGWAWAERTLFNALFMTPDDHVYQPVLKDMYDANLTFEAGRISLRYPAAQLACGIPEVLDHDNGGAHIAPWMLHFYIEIMATEKVRNGQTPASVAALTTILTFLANYWKRYGPTVNPNAVLYYPAYDNLYAALSQDYNNCYTNMPAMFAASAAAGFFPPPWPTQLYDHDQGTFHVGFPGNTDSYHVFGQAACKQHSLALPGNPDIAAALAQIKAALSAASGIGSATGGIQWAGTSNGLADNYQTHGVF